VWKVEREQEEPIEKDSRSDMNDEVYQMIAKNIELPKIVIECESKVREHSDRYLIGALDKLLNPVPGENLDVDIRILEDIGPVIEMEGDGEGIRIS